MAKWDDQFVNQCNVRRAVILHENVQDAFFDGGSTEGIPIVEFLRRKLRSLKDGGYENIVCWDMNSGARSFEGHAREELEAEIGEMNREHGGGETAPSSLDADLGLAEAGESPDLTAWKHQQRVVVKIEVNNLNTKRSSGNCLCYLVSSHVYDPVDVISAGSFLHIENIRQQIMPIFVIKDQNMPIRHTEKETADKVMAALKNPSRLFKSSVINWAGTTIDTDVQYVEVISRILLNNLEILESIPCIRRSLQYRTQGHDGIFDASSNRKEEIVGMILFNQKTVSPDYGEVLDYQIPLKANGRDKVGFKAFDLLSYDKVRNTAWILELKVSDNENDSLLHSVLEAYTYLNTVHREKLLDDFSLDTSAELKAAVLSIEGDRRYREYKALDSMPFLKQLISRLMIEVFFLSGEPAF